MQFLRNSFQVMNRSILIFLFCLFVSRCQRAELPEGYVAQERNEAITRLTNGEEMVVIAAGVPKYLAESGDYDGVFASLASANITVFLPTFQYQELPEAYTLGFEDDFLVPCSPDSPAFTALRRHNIKLLVPGQLLYPPGDFPPRDKDPLAALIACIGNEMIYAVLSIDEPFGAIRNPRQPYQDVAELYQRVKAVSPDLPVMMVHAPIPAVLPDENGDDRPITEDEVAYYLDEVRQFSQYADMIGFDVYPIPANIAQVTSPTRDGAMVDYEVGLPDYLDWLHETAVGRPYFLVLQGFSYGHLGEDARYPPDNVRAPTVEELWHMACLAQEGGATAIAWWGQSFLLERDVELWENILRTSSQVTRHC